MRSPRTPRHAGPQRDKHRSQRGFTFAEVLAALLFMAIVIPVAMQGLGVASRAGGVAQRKAVATRLADSLLNEQVVTGQWKSSGQSGGFGNRYPGYRWTLKSEPWNTDAMRLVSVEVSYPVQNRSYYVHLTTLVPQASQ